MRFLQIVPAGERDEAVERSVGVGPIDDGPLQGRVEVTSDPHRLTVAIENVSEWQGTDRREVMYRTFASAHVVARVEGGAFVSATDAAQTLEQEGGNRTRTAKVLGIAPSTLYEKIKKYNL